MNIKLLNIKTYFETVVDSIRYTSNISSITNLGSGNYRINVTDTGNLINGCYVQINSVDYKISNLVTNTSFTATSSSNVTGSTWKDLRPYLFLGTPSFISQSYDNALNDKKTYFISIFMPLTSTLDVDHSKNEGFSYNLRMFFLDRADFKTWNETNYFNNVIDIQKQVALDFVNKINYSAQVISVDNLTVKDHLKAGLSYNQAGASKNIFNDTLSGVELNLKIRFKKQFDCETI